MSPDKIDTRERAKALKFSDLIDRARDVQAAIDMLPSWAREISESGKRLYISPKEDAEAVAWHYMLVGGDSTAFESKKITSADPFAAKRARVSNVDFEGCELTFIADSQIAEISGQGVLLNWRLSIRSNELDNFEFETVEIVED